MPATPKRQGREPQLGSVFLSDVLADNIRAARSRDRRSQEDLAERMRTMGFDWSRATVSQVERSGRSVSLDEFFALAIALGVTPSELVTGHNVEHVDLGVSRSVPPNLVRLWLAGRLRVFLNDRQGGRLAASLTDPQQPPEAGKVIAEWLGHDLDL